jgi:hypothetical protein
MSFLSFMPMGINPGSLPKTQEELAQKEGKVQRAIEEVNLSLFLRLFFTPNSVRKNLPASWRYLLRSMMRAPWRNSIPGAGAAQHQDRQTRHHLLRIQLSHARTISISRCTLSSCPF